MYMPRLSLYKPQRGNDYSFIDKQVYEMFTIGGTDINIHKFLGAENPSEADATADQPRYDAVKETNIQDLLFLENRDRKYDPDVYTMRAIYNVQDIDFNLSQFGLFLSNDTLFMTIHINSSVKTIGRKVIAGDVVEIPHLTDEYALNDLSYAIKRFYVVEDVNRAAEGFSQTWYPHLYRLKLKQVVDSQEYKEILDLPAQEGQDGENTLRNMLSTYDKEMQINNAVVAQAESDAPKSGYDTSHYFSLQLDANGNTELVDSDGDNIPDKMVTPDRIGYNGYLLGDGIPTNGEAFGHGIAFPVSNQNGDFFLRTDFNPNRLFRYDGNRWVKQEDNVRMTMSQSNTKATQKGTFVNNTKTSTIGGETVVERQSLSKALRPKADN